MAHGITNWLCRQVYFDAWRTSHERVLVSLICIGHPRVDHGAFGEWVCFRRPEQLWPRREKPTEKLADRCSAGERFVATDNWGYRTSQGAAARVCGARWHVHINPAINSLYSFGSDLEGSCFSSGSSPGLYNSYCWNAVFCSCSQQTGEYLTGTPRTFTDTSLLA
jgi:hypothetical protein